MKKRVISIYSNTSERPRRDYAINLAAALAGVTGGRVMLIDMDGGSEGIANILKLHNAGPAGALTKSGIGVDVLTSERITKQALEGIRKDYSYVVVDLPLKADESTYQMYACSDAIHFFVDSSKDRLKSGHKFLEGLPNKGLEDAAGRLKVVVNRLNIFDKFSVEEMSWLLKKEVWAVVPELGILDPAIDPKGLPLVLRSRNSAYSKAILRIAKKEADKLLGLALGSGAAFGLAHIGVLRALEQRRIPIDIISGSSIGALIASMWGLGLSSDKIEHVAKKLKNRLNIMRLVDFTVPVSCILAGKRLKRFLRGILKEKTFEDLEIPVKIMVYDLANRETLVIEKGSLVEAVYMSITVPGIFKPKMEKGRVIVDGGVSDPVPVDILVKEDTKKIIAVNVLPSPEDINKRNMLLKKKLEEEENLMLVSPFYIRLGLRVKDLFRRIFTPNIFDVIMTSMQSIEYVLAEGSCKKADVVMHPVLSYASSVNFNLVKDFIKRGEEEANSHIEEIEELVKQ